MELSADESGDTGCGATEGGLGILMGSSKVEDRSRGGGDGTGAGVNLSSTFFTDSQFLQLLLILQHLA